jgi:hypothetical protein
LANRRNAQEVPQRIDHERNAARAISQELA